MRKDFESPRPLDPDTPKRIMGHLGERYISLGDFDSLGDAKLELMRIAERGGAFRRFGEVLEPLHKFDSIRIIDKP